MKPDAWYWVRVNHQPDQWLPALCHGEHAGFSVFRYLTVFELDEIAEVGPEIRPPTGEEEPGEPVKMGDEVGW